MVKQTAKAILMGLAVLGMALILEEPEFIHAILEHRREQDRKEGGS